MTTEHLLFFWATIMFISGLGFGILFERFRAAWCEMPKHTPMFAPKQYRDKSQVAPPPSAKPLKSGYTPTIDTTFKHPPNE